MKGVPASNNVVAFAATEREAIGAAYLVADQFCAWAMKQLRAK